MRFPFLEFSIDSIQQLISPHPQSHQVHSLSLSADTAKQDLEVEQLPAGIYYYQLRSNGQPQAAGKMMIQHLRQL